MFDFIFGWRKASKCKKLIRKVQCRLNLLKNKRSSIVRQLRNDVAQLIKHGHYQTAFERVDQIYKDECIIATYDLLLLFCEFVSLQLPYIRRTKDCPNDIKEAISSLIFASARCGDIPELLRIRKLFGERYGQRFESSAVNLLTGNLVNSKIIENLSIKNVSNDVRHKLVEEITTAVLQEGPLALEFTTVHQQKETQSNVHQHVDFSPNRVDFDHPTVDKSPSFRIDRAEAESESSSKNSTTDVPEEIVYLDDVEEFQSPLGNDNNGIDQRVFVFQSSPIEPVVEYHKMHSINDFKVQKYEKSRNETKKSRRRTRKRSVSPDIECSGYYDNVSYRRGANHHDKKKRSGYARTYPADHIRSPSPCGENHLLVKKIGQIGFRSRAMTMPCTRSTKHVDENGVMRSNSFPVQPSPPHVHPKLPDYNELAAKFMALKKENLQNRKMGL